MGPGVVSAHVDGPAVVAVGRAPSVSLATVPGLGIVGTCSGEYVAMSWL
jgi:hypothetical protein